MTSLASAQASDGPTLGELDSPSRLLVTVRYTEDVGARRPYRHVGFLECHDRHYEFYYCNGVSDQSGFLPLSGFPDVGRRYSSTDMFPLFAERIMSARRPDRADYLQALDLESESEPWEILARSGGRRDGDTIEVTPEPRVEADGATSCLFLVHGVRHRGQTASDAINRLGAGDELQVRFETTNPVNRNAVLVLDREQIELGYIPDPLLDYAHQVVDSGQYNLMVVRANGPDIGPHLRLLVRLSGHVDPAYVPFG